MSIVSRTQHFYPLGAKGDPLSPPLKKRRIEPKAIHDLALPKIQEMTVQDAARKNFLQSLCVQWLFMRGEVRENKVYIISSALQNDTEKMDAIKSTIQKVQGKFPNMPLEMLWVNIPKEEFFTSEHFEKMMTAIYSIPFRSIICFRAGNAFISPKRAIVSMAKQLLTSSQKKICQIYLLNYRSIPRYVISRHPCRRHAMQ